MRLRNTLVRLSATIYKTTQTIKRASSSNSKYEPFKLEALLLVPQLPPSGYAAHLGSHLGLDPLYELAVAIHPHMRGAHAIGCLLPDQLHRLSSATVRPVRDAREVADAGAWGDREPSSALPRAERLLDVLATVLGHLLVEAAECFKEFALDGEYSRGENRSLVGLGWILDVEGGGKKN